MMMYEMRHIIWQRPAVTPFFLYMAIIPKKLNDCFFSTALLFPDSRKLFSFVNILASCRMRSYRERKPEIEKSFRRAGDAET
jgi:hypothetical protein